MDAARTAAVVDGVKPPPPPPGGPGPGPVGASAGEAALRQAKAAAIAAPPPPTPSMTATMAQQKPPPSGNSHLLTAQAQAPLVSIKPPSAPPMARGGKKKGPPLRRGKWTPEEEAYANRLIQEFKAGLLPLTDGTTLRTFLSKLLNCDPMRISKKFVGSNCIGKQVFRRRTADINRLTPEQIQQSRAELSELERRFLERVAQTNRVKSSGVNGGSGGGGSNSSAAAAAAKAKADEVAAQGSSSPPSPPWLRPPEGFKPGNEAGLTNRAAAAGRALLGGNAKPQPNRGNEANNLLMAMARQSQQNLLQATAASNRLSASNLVAAAAAANGSSGISGNSLAQLVRNASAAKIAGLGAGDSISNLLRSGLSREQLNTLARDHSVTDLMGGKKNSFDALMSLDFQSLQSIDNLANLIQPGSHQSAVPKSGMKNWDGGPTSSLAATIAAGRPGGNLASLASGTKMESLIRSLSSNGNMGGANNTSIGGSNANFNSLLQSLQSNNNLSGVGASASSLLGGNPTASAINLANLLRNDSSTGLTALRVQDGLAQKNSSVDDFLSLVASGDIPHQDPHLLNVPLQNVMQQQQAAAASGNQQAAAFLAQQQLLAQAANIGNNNSLSNFNLTNNASAQSLINQLAASQGVSTNNIAAAALAQASSGAKRKHDGSGDARRRVQR